MTLINNSLTRSFRCLIGLTLVAITAPAYADEVMQKKMAPLIGNWKGQSKAFGGFEGTKAEGEIEWKLSFRWVPGKHAVEHKWQVTYVESKENFSSGSEVLYKDTKTGEYKILSSGVDGNVAWSNQGSVKWIKGGMEVTIQEQTTNGTKSDYVVRRVKDGRDQLTLSVPQRVVDGENLGAVDALILLARNPSEAKSNEKLAESFFEFLLSDPEKLKPILHSKFEFTYMGKIKETVLPYGVPYNTEDFLTKWLPHIPTVLPDGIELETLQVISSPTGVAVIQKGDAQGKYGRYDNDYVWVFNFEDGKILTVHEYNSDYLVATRLYGQEPISPKKN